MRDLKEGLGCQNESWAGRIIKDGSLSFAIYDLSPQKDVIGLRWFVQRSLTRYYRFSLQANVNMRLSALILAAVADAVVLARCDSAPKIDEDGRYTISAPGIKAQVGPILCSPGSHPWES